MERPGARTPDALSVNADAPVHSSMASRGGGAPVT
jgi:hypothetical protein